ncbi:MAG: AAA family ATPase, partial [Polyangia bacterium]
RGPNSPMKPPFCLILKGPSAVGKTSIAEGVALRLIEHKLARMRGDFYAHLVYGCSYKEEEIDLKYENMVLVGESLLRHGYSLIVDDFFRREVDVAVVSGMLARWKLPLLVVDLKAAVEILLRRNATRCEFDKMPEERIRAYPQIAAAVHWPGEVLRDTSMDSLETSVRFVVEELMRR